MLWFDILKYKDRSGSDPLGFQSWKNIFLRKYDSWIKYYQGKRGLTSDVIDNILEQMGVNKEEEWHQLNLIREGQSRPKNIQEGTTFNEWVIEQYNDEIKFQKDFKQAEKDLYKKQTAEPEKPWNISTRETKRGKWRDVLSPEEKKVEGIQEAKDKLESLRVKRTNLPPTKRGRRTQRKIDKKIEELQKFLLLAEYVKPDDDVDFSDPGF